MEIHRSCADSDGRLSKGKDHSSVHGYIHVHIEDVDRYIIALSLSASLSLLPLLTFSLPFSQGFSDLIPLPLIKVFDERELEVSLHPSLL